MRFENNNPIANQGAGTYRYGIDPWMGQNSVNIHVGVQPIVSFKLKSLKNRIGFDYRIANSQTDCYTTLQPIMASTSTLPQYKSDFISACLTGNVLTFGTYTLKSKRISPYFFNAGLLHRADLVRAISVAYAHTLASEPGLEFDVLFGPAYKGIPIAAATTIGLALVDEKRYGQVSYSFNRKEAKDHGEGGIIVGAPLKGKRVVIIDDVMTAGTAMREAIDVIEKQGGTLVGIVIAFDRMEKIPSATDDDGTPRPSTIGEFRREFKVPVMSILTLNDIVEALNDMGSRQDLKRLEEYRERYRASD